MRLLRPRGPGTRGKRTVQGGVLSSQQRCSSKPLRRGSALVTCLSLSPTLLLGWRPPEASEQCIDAAVQLLRPRGHRARGRSAGRGGMLSPHRRLGRSRPASTRSHSEPCPAQREAPESRQPAPGRDDATRSAEPPQHPHRCSSPPPCADPRRTSPSRANTIRGADDTSGARASADPRRAPGRIPRC